MWNSLIENWDQQSDRPEKISELVLDGIPDKLRGHVWQLLANVSFFLISLKETITSHLRQSTNRTLLKSTITS